MTRSELGKERMTRKVMQPWGHTSGFAEPPPSAVSFYASKSRLYGATKD
jgi:hypothetical protein